MHNVSGENLQMCNIEFHFTRTLHSTEAYFQAFFTRGNLKSMKNFRSFSSRFKKLAFPGQLEQCKSDHYFIRASGAKIRVNIWASRKETRKLKLASSPKLGWKSIFIMARIRAIARFLARVSIVCLSTKSRMIDEWKLLRAMIHPLIIHVKGMSTTRSSTAILQLQIFPKSLSTVYNYTNKADENSQETKQAQINRLGRVESNFVPKNAPMTLASIVIELWPPPAQVISRLPSQKVG